MYAESIYSGNYFCAKNCPRPVARISMNGEETLTWHCQWHFVQMLIETKCPHKWSKQSCYKSNDTECIFFNFSFPFPLSSFLLLLVDDTLRLLSKEIWNCLQKNTCKIKETDKEIRVKEDQGRKIKPGKGDLHKSAGQKTVLKMHIWLSICHYLIYSDKKNWLFYTIIETRLTALAGVYRLDEQIQAARVAMLANQCQWQDQRKGQSKEDGSRGDDNAP